jgi:fatty-acyl-CoA synthase
MVETQPGRAVAAASALARAALRPERPDRLPRAMLAMAAWGPTMAGGIAAATARYPTAPALIDEEGSLSYCDLWVVSDAVARGLRARGVGPTSTVGILALNHRGFVISVVAAAKLGTDVVYLNTGFAGPQLADVVAREGIDTLLHDDELAGIVEEAGAAVTVSETELTALGAERSYLPLVPTRRTGRTVILTSGTTGRPKGATRTSAGGLDTLTPLLSTVPIRARDTVVIPSPLFHAWGLAHLGIGLAMSSTAVLQRHFDPKQTLAAIAEHRADGLVVVPVMLQRILALGGEVIARYDTSSLRYIASSGSALGATLATAVIRRFGPILYNIYGSTEVSLASIAGPADLQAAPATAGHPVPGTVVRVLDQEGSELGPDEVGRVFVGSRSRFEGYTDGSGKENIGGLLSSGDLGHFDRRGRLFIDGREDDMIVSGGENVFPAEVEDLLAAHPAVAEAAVVGVPDDEYGQRLKAFVVCRPGARLTGREVKEHVHSHLARYKVPGSVVFVDALPRTTTGKLRRLDLLGDG